MSRKTLKELYAEHEGKVSDKWLIYLSEYERLFEPYREQPLRLLEIGIQNGGSLEIWNRYFPQAEKLVGCDINPACAQLQFEDARIAVIVGDANQDETQQRILQQAAGFDIVIDDGSHRSGDIVRSFARYFPCLAEGGLYVAEDLHCSYWEEFEGGIFHPYSSISFFKRLVDILNFEHWGVDKPRREILHVIRDMYGIELDEELLASIHSVEFVNSICVIKKAAAPANALGERVIAGCQEAVEPGILALQGSPCLNLDQSGNQWALRDIPLEEDLFFRFEEIARMKKELAGRDSLIVQIGHELGEHERRILEINRAIEECEGQILALHQEVARGGGKIAILNREVAKRDEAIVSLQQTHVHDEGMLATLMREVREREGRLATIQAEIAEREARILALQARESERKAELEQLGKAAAERDGQIAGLAHAVEERDVQIGTLQAQLAAFVNSTTWRLSLPLRIAMHQVKRARRVLELTGPALARGGGWKSTLQKAAWLYRRDGLAGIRRGFRAVALAGPPSHPAGHDRNDYAEWIRRYDTITDQMRDAMRRRMQDFAHRPLISIVMPTYNPDHAWLREAIGSVQRQIYPHWELCIADDASTDPAVRPLLESMAAADARIKLAFQETNGHISATSNRALRLASGDWMALMDHDDLLSEHALFWVAEAIARKPGLRLIYSDEDKLDEKGRRFSPYFKCDWNQELFCSHNLISHLGVYHIGLVHQVGGFRVGLEGSQDYDLALRCIERIDPSQIHHIPRVLYHWRVHAQSTAKGTDAKPYAQVAGERALNEYFERQQVSAVARSMPYGYRVEYGLPAVLPLVSLIIPTRNGLKLIKACIDSVLQKTTYPNYEILVVDNGSDDPDTLAYFEQLRQLPRVRVIRDERPFNFSALNNAAARLARGEILGLLNNDIEVISPDWLSEMVSHAVRPGVGAVGARLWYPDDTLQHGGVILGMGGVAGHAHIRLGRGHYGYFGRATLIQSLSAVTAACLLIRKEIYEAVGGLNERELKIAFNDVDFCLRVREAGYRNVWTPYADLYHHESASRGFDDAPEKQARFAQEAKYMQERWGDLLLHDPAYSPNLKLDSSDFSLAWPPRVDNSILQARQPAEAA